MNNKTEMLQYINNYNCIKANPVIQIKQYIYKISKYSAFKAPFIWPSTNKSKFMHCPFSTLRKSSEFEFIV